MKRLPELLLLLLVVKRGIAEEFLECVQNHLDKRG